MSVTSLDTPAVVADGVHVTIGDACLVHDVSFTIEHGRWLSILGPNGAGKTTLINALAGGRRSAGSVTIAGHDPRRMRARARAGLIASVAQEPELPPGMRVADYVLLGRTRFIPTFGTESATDLDAAAEVLSLVDLASFGDRTLETLSGGERRRVAIARALAQEAPVLLLDEPTTALDVGHQQEVLELVDRLRRDHRLTVVSTMHDLTLAGHYSHELLMLAGGRVVAAGPVDDVLTAEILSDVYGARVRLVDTPDGPAVVPARRAVLHHVDTDRETAT